MTDEQCDLKYTDWSLIGLMKAGRKMIDYSNDVSIEFYTVGKCCTE